MSIVSGKPLAVEFIEHNPRSILTGTGRYMRELYRHLEPLISIQRTTTIDPPLAGALTFLHHFPLGVQKHQAGSIVHFTQPLGSSVMLWNPVRPGIATVHDLSWLAWPPEREMFRKIEHLILRISFTSLKHMDAIITISDYTRETVIRQLGIPPERVFSIYSGNRTDQFKPVAGARAKLSNRFSGMDGTKDQYLLYIGNEYPRKNLSVILKALSMLPQHIRLLKVGASGGRRFREATLRTIAKLGIKDRVLFVGEVTEDELVLLYNSADLYICGSYLEGFCHPILEAMACGLPVVCSNAAALPEIAGGAAILVSPTDPESFAEAILEVLNDRGLSEKLSARGLQRAADFSWEKTAAGVVDVYRRVRGIGKPSHAS